MRKLLRWKRLSWVAVAFEGGALILIGAALAAFSWLFDSHHTLRRASWRWRAVAMSLALFGVAVAVAVPLYGHAPAFTYGEANACT